MGPWLRCDGARLKPRSLEYFTLPDSAAQMTCRVYLRSLAVYHLMHHFLSRGNWDPMHHFYANRLKPLDFSLTLCTLCSHVY